MSIIWALFIHVFARKGVQVRKNIFGLAKPNYQIVACPMLY